MALSKRHSTRCGVEFIGNAKPRVIVACSPRPGAALSDPHRNQETNLRTPIPDDIVMRAGRQKKLLVPRQELWSLLSRVHPKHASWKKTQNLQK